MEKRRLSFFIVAAGIASSVFFLSCSSKNAARNSESASNGSADTSSTSLPAAAGHAPAPGAVPDSRPVIVTFGDSLTAGVAGRSYPDDLQDLLDRSGLSYRVDNQGVSGDTTTDGLARIENVAAEHPALAILEFGGNDGLRGIPVEATKTNLSQMIERLQAAKIPVVLLGITLPPNYGPDYVQPFTAIFPDLAKQYHLPFLPFLLLHVYQNRGLMQPDGIHPNGEGNKIVARDVFALIKPVLRSSKKRTAEV